MRNCTIEFNKDQVIVSGPGGFSIDDPRHDFIEFLYMDKEKLDTLLDFKKDKARILYDNNSSFALLLWGIYNLENVECLTDEQKSKILVDLKKSQGFFYEQARIFLDENPPEGFNFETLTPRKRYSKYNHIKESVRCSIGLDPNTEETIERYYPESLDEACHILFIKLVLNNSTIKRCKHCGKYFIKRPGYNNEYCWRLIPGTNKTCKDVGANIKYKQSKDEIQKMFEKHYKKIKPYCKRNNLQPAFPIWQERAEGLRETARASGMTSDEFDSKLSEIEREVIYNVKEKK